MDQFLEWHNVPKFTQEEIGNVNRSVATRNIESITNNSLKEKKNKITLKSKALVILPMFQQKMISILNNLCHKLKAEKILPNLLYEVSITLIWKQIKTLPEKKTTCQCHLI